MKNVRNNILPNIDIKKALIQEQDNLDAMASQVKMYSGKDTKKKKIRIKSQTYEQWPLSGHLKSGRC